MQVPFQFTWKGKWHLKRNEWQKQGEENKLRQRGPRQNSLASSICRNCELPKAVQGQIEQLEYEAIRKSESRSAVRPVSRRRKVGFRHSICALSPQVALIWGCKKHQLFRWKDLLQYVEQAAFRMVHSSALGWRKTDDSCAVLVLPSCIACSWNYITQRCMFCCCVQDRKGRCIQVRKYLHK